MLRKNDMLQLIGSVLLCQAAGLLGALFTSPAISTWYATLQKPSFSPPNWVFAPVWTILYLMMGIALFLVWRKGVQQKSVQIALGLFGAQLILNVLWSLVFFGLRAPFAGFVEIVILWFAILATFWTFINISFISGLLLLPYLLWVSFALILNFSLWRLNI
jgi:translocator protein